MTGIARFLSSIGVPLLANLYTYLSYFSDPYTINGVYTISLRYMIFRPGTTVSDNGTGLSYTNLSDTMVDAFYAALEDAGAWNARVIISETGWPSAGGFGASVDNTRNYNQGLIDHIGQGTPKRPGDDSDKSFGLFYPDRTPVYPIRF